MIFKTLFSNSYADCCGDNKCDTKKGESALVCPIDCS